MKRVLCAHFPLNSKWKFLPFVDDMANISVVNDIHFRATLFYEMVLFCCLSCIFGVEVTVPYAPRMSSIQITFLFDFSFCFSIQINWKRVHELSKWNENFLWLFASHTIWMKLIGFWRRFFRSISITIDGFRCARTVWINECMYESGACSILCLDCGFCNDFIHCLIWCYIFATSMLRCYEICFKFKTLYFYFWAKLKLFEAEVRSTVCTTALRVFKVKPLKLNPTSSFGLNCFDRYIGS